MSSAQNSEEIELDYDHVSKNKKTNHVENLCDFFILDTVGVYCNGSSTLIEFCYRYINIFLTD